MGVSNSSEIIGNIQLSFSLETGSQFQGTAIQYFMFGCLPGTIINQIVGI
jgi:hypothetical protein